MEPTFATRWFFSNVEGGKVKLGGKVCAVCGLPMLLGTPVDSVLRKTFTDYAALRVPDSGYACDACVWYFDHQNLRRSSWWLTATRAHSLSKEDVGPLLRAHLDCPPDEDGYYLISVMHRKHLALWAPLNMAGASVRRVRFETVTVALDRDWLALVEAAHKLREFHSWKEIQSDNYNSKFLIRWGDISEFARLREVVKPWLRTATLDLVQYIWTEKKEVGR